MQFVVTGRLNKRYFIEVEQELSKLLPVPAYIEKIIITDDLKYTKKLFRDFPKKIQDEFKAMFSEEPAPMAFTYRNTEVIVVPVTKLNSYLKKHHKAAIGAIAHELTHVFHTREGLNDYMEECLEKYFDQYYNRLEILKLPEKEISEIASELAKNAIYVLKDLYMIRELMSRGLGDHILEDYFGQFIQHITPPVFYKDFKTATRKEILDAVYFELSLLTVLLPFQNYANPKATKLIRHLQREYEPKIQEIVKEFYGLDRLYDAEFSWSWSFQRQFLDKIFESTAALLKGRKN